MGNKWEKFVLIDLIGSQILNPARRIITIPRIFPTSLHLYDKARSHQTQHVLDESD